MYITLTEALMYTDAGEKNNCTIAINTDYIVSIETGHTLTTAQRCDRYSLELANGTTVMFDKRINGKAFDAIKATLNIEIM